MDIRVMTFNIQHGHVHLSDPGRIDLSVMADVIRDAGADIIGLNEVRGRGERPDYTAQTEAMAAILGYHGYFGRSFYVGGWNPYGNAVLSRWPIVEAKVFRIPDPALKADAPRFEPRSILRAVIDLPDGGRFAVYASHFGLSHVEAEHAASLAASLTAEEPLPFALMGDFNVTPDDPVLAPLDASLCETHSILTSRGELSHPSHAPADLIDFIYTARSVTVKDVHVHTVVASDHCPVVADLSF
ncbi:MAG: endonuclease/exonuclease/phosphatase family protein [Clostridiales bacterium]|nr:endonuclease/exonuclease/phosphatase family protein [Clostridiales bacterium]